jgi:hypothetical protein
MDILEYVAASDPHSVHHSQDVAGWEEDLEIRRKRKWHRKQ